MPNVSIPTVKARELGEIRNNVTVVDLRVSVSHSEMGRFAGALHIPLDELSGRYTEIPKDKSVVLMDYSGVEFPHAGRFLKHKAYKDVKGLQGGLLSWIRDGYNLEKN